MSRCEHGQKIVKFCLTNNCKIKESGGCQYCMKKFHCHFGATKIITENELEEMLKMLSVSPETKFKSRPFQQAIYSYFSMLKSQVSSSLDAISRELLNRIGYPYLKRQGKLETFKKIKHRQYRKLGCQEMRQFYGLKDKLQQQNLEKVENEFYKHEVRDVMNSISKINSLFTQYGQIVARDYDKSYKSESLFYQKINEIYQSIDYHIQSSARKQTGKKQDIKKNNTKTEVLSKFDSIKHEAEGKSQNNKSEEARKAEYTPKKETNKDLDATNIVLSKDNPNKPLFRVESLPQETIENNSSIIKKRQRKVSLDNKVDLGFKPSNYDAREREISQKKKKLYQMLAYKNPLSDSEKKALDVESQKLDEDLDEGGNIFEKLMEQGINFTDLIMKTVLPPAQLTPKLYQNVEKVTKQVIKVPVHPFQESEQCSSPILKKRKNSHMANFSLTLENASKNLLNQSTHRKEPQPQPETEKPQFSDNQADSLGLLIESLKMGESKAIKILELALNLAPNNLSAAEYLSFLYLEANEAKKCLEVCNSILKIVEDSQQSELSMHIINNKANALNLLGRYSQAISLLEKCLQLVQSDDLYKNLADSYYCLGIYEKAVTNYEQALQINNENDEAHFNLAVCLFSQQNFASCKLEAQKALLLKPDHDEYAQLVKEVSKIIE